MVTFLLKGMVGYDDKQNLKFNIKQKATKIMFQYSFSLMNYNKIHFKSA